MRRLRAMVAALAVAAALGGAPHAVGAATTTSPTPDACTRVTQPALAAAGWLNEPTGAHYSCTHVDPSLGLQRHYWVYAPSGWDGVSSLPLFVVLHGCTEQAPDIAYIARFDWEAEAKHFLVAYPEQAAFTMTGTTSFDGNGSKCWNWFLPQGQERGAGEPALIAGITRNVITVDHADHRRVFVIGVSAGAATADIMAATYPELYAAAGVIAGCEYKGLPCFGSVATQPPQLSGELAYQASAGHARVMPFLVENGDADNVVPAPNAIEVTQQWQVTDDMAAHGGALTQPVPSAPCATVAVTPSPAVDATASPPIVYNPYDIAYYSHDGAACPAATPAASGLLGELIIVHGEAHAWPGGPQPTVNEIYTDPGGPDLTGIAYAFFMAHPCRVHAGVCVAGA